MALLHETQSVLAEMAATRQQDFGMHTALQPKTGVPGLDVGEQPFDAARHAVTSINPLSLMEMATDIPHVRQVIPKQPLDVTVITHHESGRDRPEFAALKLFLARQIKQAIEESVPGMTDQVHAYHLAEEDDRLDWDAEFIRTSAEPLWTAKTAADLCRNGLTFVISDFNHLPLQDVGGRFFPATIAVKANHMADLAVPEQRVFRLGGRREVSRPKEAQKMNAALTAYHQGIEQGLESVGIKVAAAVLSAHDVKTTGFDVAATDAAIAMAARRVEL